MRRTGIPPSNYTLSVIAKLANRCLDDGSHRGGCLLSIRCSRGSKKPKMAFKIVEALRDLAGHEFQLVAGNVYSKFPKFSVACVKVWNMASS